MHKRSCFYLSLFLILSSLLSTAQLANFKNYSVIDGLAQSQVYAITESPDGYLWIGTRGGGLCRFDGIEFETFTKKDGLSSNYINSLFVDRQQNLWIATSNGLCMRNKNDFISFPYPDDSVYIITAVLEDTGGTIWIGTDQGLYYIRDSSFVKKELPVESSNLEVTCLMNATNGGFWTGTNRGLFNLKADTILSYRTADGLPANYVTAIAYDPQQNLWIGTYGYGISILNPDGIVNPEPLQQIRSSIIHSLLNDSKGNMWISTFTKGLIKWNHSDSSMTFFNETNGLSNNHVRCTYEDLWGNIWIGTSGAGLCKFFGQYFDHYNVSSTQLKSNYIFAVEAANDTDIWIATSGLGINRYLNNKTLYYGADSGFTDAKVKVILKSDSNHTWFGTEGKGLFLYDGKRFISANFNSKIGSAWIKDLVKDTTNSLWVATSGAGISRISVNSSNDSTALFSYLRIDREQGLLSSRVSVLHADSTNRIWFAYQSGGLGYIDHDTVVHHFPASHPFGNLPVRTMAEDRQHNLWIGTAGKGVYRLKLYSDSLSFINFTSEGALISDNIYLLGIDLQSYLWVGSEKGVEKIKTDAEGNMLEITRYGYDEGFKGVETSTNAITVDDRGGVWIGTINGLYRYNSNYKNSNSKPPILSITDVSLFYTSVKNTMYADYLQALENDPEARISLNYDQNHITFDFKGLLLTKPNSVLYKWKLEGLENEWSPATKKRSITYSNLDAGKYRFLVMASNEDGVWNEQPQTVSFEILVPFWKTNRFMVIAILTILALAAMITWLRVRAIKRKARTAQELLRMENDVLLLKQKALQLQMNPHFIFNCLNSIQSMIVKKDDKTARYFLSKFSKLMRKTLDNSREQLISLDDEIETLENYLSLEKFCNEDHFDYSIEVEDEVISDFVQIPPMIIQPFVENAIVHGVAHRKSGGKIRITFRLEGKMLVCTIEDNGVGRNKAKELNKNRPETHKSTALIVTQERLNYLGNDVAVKPLIIEDLYDESGTGRGTKVIIRIRLED